MKLIYLTVAFAAVVAFTNVAHARTKYRKYRPDRVDSLRAKNKMVDMGQYQIPFEYSSSSSDVVFSSDFNSGFYMDPLMLLKGRVAGLNIVSINGRFNSGTAASINGTTSFLGLGGTPLIIVDDVPLYNLPLHLNSNDIESFSVLKYPASAGCYPGMSNEGAIVIRTKRAQKEVQVSFSEELGFSHLLRDYELVTGDEYRSRISRNYGLNSNEYKVLGDANTNWVDKVIQQGVHKDYYLGVGGVQQKVDLPWRLSIGNSAVDGILKNDEINRTTGQLIISPNFFNKRLKVDVSAGLFYEKNRLTPSDVIANALLADPTQETDFYRSDYDAPALSPIDYVENQFEGLVYFKRNMGLKADYHFEELPELSLGLITNVTKYTVKERLVGKPKEEDIEYYNNRRNVELNNNYLELYTRYRNKLNAWDSYFELNAGTQRYDVSSDESFEKDVDGYYSNGLYSFNHSEFNAKKPMAGMYLGGDYNLFKRYSFSVKARYNMDSRFYNEEVQGVFTYGGGIAWNMHNESFLINQRVIDLLKLRFNLGKVANYPYEDNQYSEHVFILRNKNSTYEVSHTGSVGMDFSLFKHRLSGSVELFYKEREGLANVVTIPAYSGDAVQYETNASSSSTGCNFAINSRLIQDEHVEWSVFANMSAQRVIFESSPDMKIYSHGDWLGTSRFNDIIVSEEGNGMYSYNVLEQKYDREGNPLWREYVDHTHDGLTDARDRQIGKLDNYVYYSSLGTSLRYEKWTVSALFEGQSGKHLLNVLKPYDSGYELMFNSNETSDYFIEKADFVKIDYVSLGYQFQDLFHQGLSLGLSAVVQNAYVFTAYSGQNPEEITPTDYSQYPQARTYTLKLSLSL